MVALRKESVDRNFADLHAFDGHVQSLSARRAWIEMGMTRASIWLWVVALRKESVDRNFGHSVFVTVLRLSLSARRAWIEILKS